MHNNVLVFDGVSTDVYSTYITSGGIYDSPEPEYERISIEGRNGDLLIEKDRYSNIQVRYPTIVYDNFESNYMKLRSYLMSKKGYKRIEDSFAPDKFRIGRFTGNINPKYSFHRNKGSFDILFDCKPQWFLKSGEVVVTQERFGSGLWQFALFNPTEFTAKPLIRVYGYGALFINGYRMTVAQGATQYIDIDTDLMDSYEGSTSRNNLVTRNDKVYLTLAAGFNTVQAAHTITKLEITPRWYEL